MQYFSLAFATANMIWITTQQPQQHAVAQSPMDMMNMMMGGGNMSVPFNMGHFSHAHDVYSPNQLLESLSGMFGGGMTGDDDNATQQQIMKEMMRQQMMSQVGRIENMTESNFQQAMNLVICIPLNAMRC